MQQKTIQIIPVNTSLWAVYADYQQEHGFSFYAERVIERALLDNGNVVSHVLADGVTVIAENHNNFQGIFHERELEQFDNITR